MDMDAALVSRLVHDQFPAWRELSVVAVQPGGWDNRIIRLGDRMLVRMPTAEAYADAILKEQTWLPRLAPSLPLAIPEVVALGSPGHGYPWFWSVYRWIDGTPATTRGNDSAFAETLAAFLRVFHQIPADDSPGAGAHNFHRGGRLDVYDHQMRQAIARLANPVEKRAVASVWEAALESRWTDAPVWVHGDLAAGNLLVQKGKLRAVIDFGQLGAGDPACDLTVAWTMFTGAARRTFRDTLAMDDATWARAKGWATWKALILVTGLIAGPAAQVCDAKSVLAAVLEDGPT